MAVIISLAIWMFVQQELHEKATYLDLTRQIQSYHRLFLFCEISTNVRSMYDVANGIEPNVFDEHYINRFTNLKE